MNVGTLTYRNGRPVLVHGSLNKVFITALLWRTVNPLGSFVAYIGGEG